MSIWVPPDTMGDLGEAKVGISYPRIPDEKVGAGDGIPLTGIVWSIHYESFDNRMKTDI